MNLRIVGRDGQPPRVVDLDDLEPLHPDDRILAADGRPAGNADGHHDAPAGDGHEPWSHNWVDALERDLGRWLNRNSVDSAVGMAEWEIARAVLVYLRVLRGPLFPRVVVHHDPTIAIMASAAAFPPGWPPS